jgi:hypothetical protein
LNGVERRKRRTTMKRILIEGAIDVPDDTDFDDFTDTFESVMFTFCWQFFGILQPPEQEKK